MPLSEFLTIRSGVPSRIPLTRSGLPRRALSHLKLPFAFTDYKGPAAELDLRHRQVNTFPSKGASNGPSKEVSGVLLHPGTDNLLRQ